MARTLFAALAFAAVVCAQPIPSMKDYCYHNPDAFLCAETKPWEKLDLQKGIIYQPNEPPKKTPARTAAAAPVRPQISQTTSDPAPVPDYKVPQAWRKRGTRTNIKLGELDWRLLQDGADMFIGLNMSGLAESELARTLIGQWARMLGATEEEQKNLIAALGDIPQAVISIQGKEIVAVLTGRVDSFPERASIGGLQYMRVSADTVALGTPNGLKWAIWRLNFAPNPNASMKEAQQLAATNDFWVWARPQALAAFGQGFNPNTPVSKIRMGASFRDQFRMDLFLETANPAAAARVLEASQKGAPRGARVGVEGSVVHYGVVFDRDTTLQRFAGFISDPMGKQFAPLLKAAREIAARQGAPARSAPGKIVIDGLDDGPREIPATRK